jgi:hypothetical protein
MTEDFSSGFKKFSRCDRCVALQDGQVGQQRPDERPTSTTISTRGSLQNLGRAYATILHSAGKRNVAVWSTIGSVGVASAADLNKLLFLNSTVQPGPGTGGEMSNPEVSVTARRPAAPSLITLVRKLVR